MVNLDGSGEGVIAGSVGVWGRRNDTGDRSKSNMRRSGGVRGSGAVRGWMRERCGSVILRPLCSRSNPAARPPMNESAAGQVIELLKKREKESIARLVDWL